MYKRQTKGLEYGEVDLSIIPSANILFISSCTNPLLEYGTGYALGAKGVFSLTISLPLKSFTKPGSSEKTNLFLAVTLFA